MEYRALAGEQELDAWLDLCDACFRSHRGYFEEHFKLDATRDASLIFVAIDDGLMVGSVRVFPRTVSVRGQGAQSMAGIGEVCTRPSHRGKGIQRILMTMAMEEARKREFSLASLHSASAVIDMYRKFGFHSVPMVQAFEVWNRSALDAAAAAWSHDVQPIEAAAYRERGAPDFARASYAKRAEHFTGPLIRSADYWGTWLARQSKEVFSAQLAVASTSADGACHAYLAVGAPKRSEVPEDLRAQTHQLRLKVLDFVCEPPELARAALGALAACAARAAGEQLAAPAAAPATAPAPPAPPAGKPTGASPSVAGTGDASDPLLLACMPAAWIPAPASDDGSGITRLEETEETVMYSRLCADDAVWAAVAAAGPTDHTFLCADAY